MTLGLASKKIKRMEKKSYSNHSSANGKTKVQLLCLKPNQYKEKDIGRHIHTYIHVLLYLHRIGLKG